MAIDELRMFPDSPIPPHVPAALVSKDFPFIFGMTTDRDPFNDMAAAVHEGPPIIYAMHAYIGATPSWVPRRVADLRNIYFDTEHFSSTGLTVFAQLVGETWINSPAELDPPDHGPFRALVNPLFSPKTMTRLEDKIRQYARDHVARLMAQGSCEFMRDFAFEFPIKVFLELMGLPQNRLAEFVDWEMNLIHNHDLSKVEDATRKVVALLRAEIADRRAFPRDDLITFAVQAEKQGRPLTDDEVVGFTFNLFVGGLDTVSTNLGLQFLHLATHPEDQTRLRAHPEEISGAIEEMMRAYAAVTVFRTCRKEVVVNGVTFAPGDRVAMSTTLAGRDPEEFENPAEIRFNRRPRHVSFGYGPHLCIGMHLARREMRIAIEEFLATIPPFHVVEDHVIRYHLGVVQPVALPLAW